MPFVQVDGYKLNYLDEGKGAPLILGHGLCMDHSMFAAQVEALSTTYRVIAPDWRGHGESQALDKPYSMEDQADDLYRLMTHLGLTHAHVGGMSMGGMIALRFALAHPEMTDSLILIDTDAGPESPHNRIRYNAMAMLLRFGLARLVIDKTMRILFGAHFLRSQPEQASDWRSRILAQSPIGLYQATRCVTERSDLRGRISLLRAPTLVICGEHDLATPPSKNAFLARTIPTASLVMIPDSGHSSPVEQPSAVTQAIQGFLAGMTTIDK